MPRRTNRQNGKLPAYCHHKPTGQAYVRLRIDGRRQTVYLGPHNSRESLERYDQVVGEWLARKSVPAKHAGPTVQDVAERYRSYRHPSDPDEGHTLESTVRLLVELFGDRPADEFDAMQFDRFKSELARRYSRSYGNKQIGWVKRIFKWAAQRRIIPTDNLVLVESVEPLTASEAPTKIVGPIDDQAVEATLPELSPPLAHMARFIRQTGCRPSEARLMRAGDVDRQSWLLELASHKTAHKGKARFIVIPPEARDELLPRLLRPADRYVFSDDSEGRRPYEKRALGRAIDRAIRRINRQRREAGQPEIAHWHPYQLRHARAVEVREHFGAEVAQVLLGHSRIDMTQHYAKLTRDKAEEIARLLG